MHQALVFLLSNSPKTLFARFGQWGSFSKASLAEVSCPGGGPTLNMRVIAKGTHSLATAHPLPMRMNTYTARMLLGLPVLGIPFALCLLAHTRTSSQAKMKKRHNQIKAMYSLV